jgi:hypothetical protein
MLLLLFATGAVLSVSSLKSGRTTRDETHQRQRATMPARLPMFVLNQARKSIGRKSIGDRRLLQRKVSSVIGGKIRREDTRSWHAFLGNTRLSKKFILLWRMGLALAKKATKIESSARRGLRRLRSEYSNERQLLPLCTVRRILPEKQKDRPRFCKSRYSRLVVSRLVRCCRQECTSTRQPVRSADCISS